ncbi:mannitol dehydrogenase family protein [Verminephrobacter aporrectodeae subsp. tuberculatae]|uniref:mannitol dehydrogenase family protein n=1 Tax=Verminephrobacter aporrectodeae TaxID=1110389 RepID=UPI0022387DA6|nr:mannitol dehydrogenase family protein [Verminephrobacter aporrectodeae]MCW5221466.1 mannitol dehydrogenase family protein [Verminephrobacter aporrectodeae subsp. tuberculatae]MCW5290757.1 mannitol dehydrogenase family protein [Verminephrobacter aporrectodeae subsp. tuberculatae]
MNAQTHVGTGRLTPLSNATLGALGAAVAAPAYERSRLRAGIAHIGVGNFHRAHEALYVDRCLHRPGHEDWAICGIGLGDTPAARAKAEAFKRQDGLYTLSEFAPDGAVSSRVIGAMIEYLHAPSNPDAVLRKLSDPALRIVSLTITEGGYNIDEASGTFALHTPDVASDLAGNPPRTAFGFIVEALRRRMESSVAPFSIVSCDNLRHNGDTTRLAVVSFARARDAQLAEWINAKSSFPNSMVDRIAPRVPAPQRQQLNARTGIDDALHVVGERFTQWVMEDRFGAGRPDFGAVGVELRADVPAFEGIKGRLLNASHMLLAYPALLCGYRLVHEAMQDVRLANLLDRFMSLDVIPLLQAPAGVSLHAYKQQVLSRFNNAAVADQLPRIAHDGVSKIPVFHSSTLRALVDAGSDIRRAAFFLACFQRYFKGVDDQGLAFAVHEPQLSEEDRQSLLQGTDPLAVLRTTPFRALRLYDDMRFASAFLAASDAIEKSGTRQALDALLADR